LQLSIDYRKLHQQIQKATFKPGVYPLPKTFSVRDLSAIETIEAIVEIVDAELMEDVQYLSMGKTPAERVKTLLGQLDSVRRSKELGYEVATQARLTSHKFVGSVEKIFKNLPKPLEWRSFLNNDLPLLVDICKEVQEVSIQPQLSEKCSIGCSLLYVIRYLTRYHLDFDNSIPARFRVPEFGNSLERLATRPPRLKAKPMAGRWQAGPPAWRGPFNSLGPLEPKDCLYIGDSEVDFEVCRAAGVPLIAYKNKDLEADIHIESLAEIKEVLKLPGRLTV
jgi:hypothetical protein